MVDVEQATSSHRPQEDNISNTGAERYRREESEDSQGDTQSEEGGREADYEGDYTVVEEEDPDHDNLNPESFPHIAHPRSGGKAILEGTPLGWQRKFKQYTIWYVRHGHLFSTSAFPGWNPEAHPKLEIKAQRKLRKSLEQREDVKLQLESFRYNPSYDGFEQGKLDIIAPHLPKGRLRPVTVTVSCW